MTSQAERTVKDLDEPRDTRRWRLQEAHQAFFSLQSLMLTQLQGCGGQSSAAAADGDETWFSFWVLAVWTLSLAVYTWYMLRNFTKFHYTPPPPMPSTMDVPQAPEVSEDSTSP